MKEMLEENVSGLRLAFDVSHSKAKEKGLQSSKNKQLRPKAGTQGYQIPRGLWSRVQGP